MERFEPQANHLPEQDPLHSPDLVEPPVKDFSQFVTHYQDEPDSQFQPLNLSPLATPNRKMHTGRFISGAVLAILLIGGAVVLANKNQPAVHKVATSTVHTSSKAAAVPKIATTSYTANNFNVALEYPTGWNVVSDTASSVLIESPVMQLKTAASQTLSGKVLVTIQPQGQLPTSFGTADATAVSTSKLITYVQPTSNQRAQTYISFVQYAATTTSGALDGIYITGDYGYQKDQTIPRTDLTNLNPLVTVTFGNCADTKCTSLTSTNIPVSTFDNPTFSAPILTLLESLAFS
jgi:hypothetical protein